MKFRLFTAVIIVLLYNTCIYNGEKVLFFPIQQGSHTNTQQNIIKEMISRGHDVHLILGSEFGAKFKDKFIKHGVKIIWFQQNKNREYTGANLDQLFEKVLKNFNSETSQNVWDTTCDIINTDCYDFFEDIDFIKTVQSNNFDVAVIDYWHASPCNILLAYNLSIPFIIQSVAVFPWLIREPALPSFVPWILGMESHQMTFWQRFKNIFMHINIYNLQTNPRRNMTLIQRYAPGASSYNEIFTKAKFYISMRNHILEWPQPAMANHIRLFGTTFSDPNPLSGELNTTLTEANTDVIVVSFGSMGGKIPLEYVAKIITAMGHLKETVIFSYSGNTKNLGILPSNVKIFPWLPQNDVLAHPKVKLFITHGGHNGQSEAVYHGVPMLTMPLYFEQFHNAFRVEKHKYGLSLNIYDFTPEELVIKTKELLINPIFMKNVKLASAIVKDSPKHPSALAADWIEHILRFGSDHLRSSAMDMPLYEILMLDILALLLFILIVFLVFVYSVFKCIFRMCEKKRKEKLS